MLAVRGNKETSAIKSYKQIFYEICIKTLPFLAVVETFSSNAKVYLISAMRREIHFCMFSK